MLAKVTLLFLFIVGTFYCELDVDQESALKDVLDGLNYDYSDIEEDFCESSGIILCDDEVTRSVSEISLSGYSLSGTISNDIGKLEKLIDLNLSGNLIKGTIPLAFSTSLGSLQSIDLSRNRLSGEVPDFGSDELTYINLSENLIEGTIPPAFSNSLGSLESIDLSGNRLKGVVPQFLSDKLTYISLRGNLLDGEIGEKFKEQKNLETIDISRNMFNGNLPEFHQDSPLRRIDLSGNQFTGEISEEIIKPGLDNINLSNNGFTGTIPDVLAAIPSVDLSGNMLSGEIEGDILDRILDTNDSEFRVTQNCLGKDQSCEDMNFSTDDLYSIQRRLRKNLFLNDDCAQYNITTNIYECREILDIVYERPDGFDCETREDVCMAMKSIMLEETFTVYEHIDIADGRAISFNYGLEPVLRTYKGAIFSMRGHVKVLLSESDLERFRTSAETTTEEDKEIYHFSETKVILDAKQTLGDDGYTLHEGTLVLNEGVTLEVDEFINFGITYDDDEKVYNLNLKYTKYKDPESGSATKVALWSGLVVAILTQLLF